MILILGFCFCFNEELQCNEVCTKTLIVYCGFLIHVLTKEDPDLRGGRARHTRDDGIWRRTSFVRTESKNQCKTIKTSVQLHYSNVLQLCLRSSSSSFALLCKNLSVSFIISSIDSSVFQPNFSPASVGSA